MNEREDRPWGCFEILYQECGLKIKKITVLPGKRLSLQSHDQRSEYWVIVQGRAVVTVDEREQELTMNQGIFIPGKSRHRMENKGDENLVFVEVQRGSYLGEDDITRFQDDFQRI